MYPSIPVLQCGNVSFVPKRMVLRFSAPYSTTSPSTTCMPLTCHIAYYSLSSISLAVYAYAQQRKLRTGTMACP